jgi:hypothetical protein
MISRKKVTEKKPDTRFLLLRQLNTPEVVIPAKAGIQINTGCRIKSGMTKLVYSIAGLITCLVTTSRTPTQRFRLKARHDGKALQRY